MRGEVVAAEGPWVEWAGPSLRVTVRVNDSDSGCSGAAVSEGCPPQCWTTSLAACGLTASAAGDGSGEGTGTPHVQARFAACGDGRSEDGDGARRTGAMDN